MGVPERINEELQTSDLPVNNISSKYFKHLKAFHKLVFMFVRLSASSLMIKCQTYQCEKNEIPETNLFHQDASLGFCLIHF